ncbi:signal peptidase I [Microbacterium phosphatis]|uniref:signal peptidase I n=1 Tax=Microbacterium phosphatis TaxID=3140248 RepID=UPI003140229D
MTTIPVTLPVPTAADAGHSRDHEPPEAERDGRRFAERHPALHALWMGISGGLLALVLLVGVLTVIVPKAVGGVPLTVLSPSMEPSLPVGTLLVVRPVEPEDIRIGDIVTYLPYPNDPTLVTHRVTEIAHHQDGSRVFTLQGDNNAVADSPVHDYQVRAVVMYSVPLLGYVSQWVNVDQQTWVVLVTAGALFVYAGFTVVSAARDRRRRRQEAEAEQGAEAPPA